MDDDGVFSVYELVHEVFGHDGGCGPGAQAVLNEGLEARYVEIPLSGDDDEGADPDLPEVGAHGDEIDVLLRRPVSRS